MSPRLRTITLWLVIFFAVILVAQRVRQQETPTELTLAELVNLGDSGRVVVQEGPDSEKEIVKENSIIKEIKDVRGNLTGVMMSAEKKAPIPFKAEYDPISGQGRDIYAWAMRNGIAYKAERPNEFLNDFLPQILVMVILLGVLWFFLARQFQSGSNKAMSFGKSRAKLVTEGQVKVTFADVAGIDEVRDELQEIIQFLKDPDRFSRLGGKIPKGALLHGPPGTGKTLIARATAGEASVPFFSISGSDFVEMFVGVGASRVRDLFEQGKKAKPCLIYIDEIDAVGRSRFSGFGGGHDEREQTLNALLVELDGFAPNEGVIVMASTNRPDVLDPALLRPGRFDRQIRVDLPDVRGREKILEVHTRELKMSKNHSLKEIAKGTPGFSGADLANLANEAALLAARADKKAIDMEDLNEAKDRVMMGPARRSLAMSEEERIHTAYHESGHALVAKLTGSDDNRVHKVTIIPRGRSLGLTAILPEKEQFCKASQQLFDMLVFTMGGRAAEEIKFNDTSTGVGNDLQRATDLAHRMVCEFGMNKNLGPRTFGSPSTPVFVGRDMVGRDRDFSEATASLIDAEVKEIINSAYNRAKELLLGHTEELERVSQALLDRETIDGHELDLLINGEELPPLFKEEENNKKKKTRARKTAKGKASSSQEETDETPKEEETESSQENPPPPKEKAKKTKAPTPSGDSEDASANPEPEANSEQSK